MGGCSPDKNPQEKGGEMSTNQQVIDNALFAGGVIEAGASANATDSASALSDFNAMMAEWGQSSKDLNWFPQDDLTATCPIPTWAERGVIANLAISLAPVFRYPVTNDLNRKANQGINVITRTLINLNLDPADMTHLPMGEGRYSSNIETGI